MPSTVKTAPGTLVDTVKLTVCCAHTVEIPAAAKSHKKRLKSGSILTLLESACWDLCFSAEERLYEFEVLLGDGVDLVLSLFVSELLFSEPPLESEPDFESDPDFDSAVDLVPPFFSDFSDLSGLLDPDLA